MYVFLSFCLVACFFLPFYQVILCCRLTIKASIPFILVVCMSFINWEHVACTMQKYLRTVYKYTYNQIPVHLLSESAEIQLVVFSSRTVANVYFFFHFYL